MTPHARRWWGGGALVVMLAGCPPPEVLYGDAAFDDEVPKTGAPTLPSQDAHAPVGVGHLTRLQQVQHARRGPGPAEVREGPHVEWSGTIACSACVETLLLQVIALDDAGSPPPPGSLAGGYGRTPLVAAIVTPGPFSVPVPKVDRPVGVELLVDMNGDGLPSIGERYVSWIEADTPLRTHTDREGIVLDATDRPTGRDERVQPGGPTGR